jgi:RimJ/RimL family protein N-acetyltransferase
VISVIHRDNQPSIRVAERLGERFEREMEVAGMPALIYGIARAKT